MVDRVAGLKKNLEARTASKVTEEGKEEGTGSTKETEKKEEQRAEFQIRGSAGDSLPSTKELAGSPVFTTAEEFIQKRFSHADLSHPFLTELFRICTHRQTPQLALQKLSGSNQTAAGPESPPGVSMKSPSSAGIQKKDINYIVDGLTSLASLPRIIFEIDRVINDPRSSASQVADVISKDPNITMKLLKIVNSAFYNFTSKIDTISRAVAILGSEELRTLAMGTSILEMFKGIPEDLVNMKSFWEHSVACGTAARLIGSHMKIAETERLFVGGLLHDIGRLIVYKHLPQQGREMLLRAKRDGSLLYTVELEFLGFDHSQIGAALIQKWRLPATLEQTVGYHHQPTLSQYPSETSIVHIADILANALMIGTSGEWFVPPLSPEAWTKLGLPVGIFTDSIQLIDQQVAEFVHIFLGDL
jgi:putative nucleotidyltransferase with HDIG domain